jgi:glycine/D-amino acid oxidase-like deaminating enzyme
MRGADHAEEMPALRGLVKALVPGVAAVAWETAPCLITETPSDLPYLDHVAEGLVLAAGGNGYAAKSANAIGELAARLVLEGRWTDPVLDPARFAVA